jgi:glycosyltransferase involved in cell wall biosynthesis
MKNPLISIIISTYNSSDFIIATLDSIKDQTYQRIQLIISDDCSTDQTVKICTNWLVANSRRFTDSKIIQSSKNTGVVGNANRGLKIANGAWIKFLAGDDILMPEYCETLIREATEKKLVLICSKILPFSDEDISPIKASIESIQKYWEDNYDFFAGDQLENYLKRYFIPSPSVLIKKELLDQTNGFDEDFPVEDVPYWLKLLNLGYRFYLVDEYLVRYRIHSKSLSNSKFINTGVINTRSYEFSKKIFLKLTKNIFFKRKMYAEYYSGYARIFRAEVLLMLGNKKTIFNKLVFNTMTLILLPKELQKQP